MDPVPVGGVRLQQPQQTQADLVELVLDVGHLRILRAAAPMAMRRGEGGDRELSGPLFWAAPCAPRAREGQGQGTLTPQTSRSHTASLCCVCAQEQRRDPSKHCTPWPGPGARVHKRDNPCAARQSPFGRHRSLLLAACFSGIAPHRQTHVGCDRDVLIHPGGGGGEGVCCRPRHMHGSWDVV